MGEADRYQEYKLKKYRFTLGQNGNALVGLLIINAAFLMTMLTLRAGYYFYLKTEAEFNAEVIPWFQVPGSFAKLGNRPWTLFSAMFTDLSLFRIFSNMVWLWAFGSLLQWTAGNRRLIPIYIYGGFVGALFFLLANTLIPALHIQQEFTGMMGANAAVMAIAMATCMFVPNHRFFPMIGGGISIWVLMLLYLAIDYVGIAGNGAAFSLAHLGGALAGFLFVLFYRRGWDGSKWMNDFYDWFMNLFNPYKKSNSSIKEKVFYNKGKREPFSKTANITQQRIDEILDKINQKGYNHLSEEEKNFLKRAAEE